MAQAPNKASLFGLPSGVRSVEDLNALRRKESNDAFVSRMKTAAAGMQPGQSLIFNQFAQLGRALGNKMMGPERVNLTEEDQQGLFAMEAFNKFQDEAQMQEGYAKLDATEKSFVHQESMIKALQQAGRQDEALALAGDLQEKRLNHRLKNAQASKLESEAAEEAAQPTAADRASAVLEFAGAAYSDTELKNHRELIKSTDDMVKIAGAIADTFEAASSPDQIVGNVGGLERLVGGIGRFIEGGVRMGTKLFDEDGKATGTLRDKLDLVPDSLVPDAIRNDAKQASRYKAAIMQMVYADARLNEPGARQLSDADIENAMVRLGVDSNDPQTVVEVFFDNMENRIMGMDEQFNRIATVYEPVGGRDALRTVYGTDVIANLSEKREKIAAIRGRGQKQTEPKPTTSAAAAPATGTAAAPLAPEDDALLTDLGL